jgi:hypothetical protein
MKKLFLFGIFAMSTSSLVFANNCVERKDVEKKSTQETKELKKENNEETLCRVTCRATYNVQGGTYTVETSAGSIFTSCETATARCQEKLEKALQANIN